MSTPILSRLAVVQIGGTAIGFLTDFTSDFKAELIKEYVCQTAATPAVLDSGNQSYTFKASMLFVPSTYAAMLNDVLNSSSLTIVYGPAGISSGNPKITYSNVSLTAFSVKNGQKGTIANDISGEAQSVTVGTF
jgi:hypothetical protein